MSLDFIIGGAPRAGTTWLAHALGRHPGVRMITPFVPEPKTFILGGEQPPEEYRRRLDALAATPRDGRIIGEKTANYFESADACRRIRTHLPNVRLIFVLREPVARAYSNWLWSRKNGLETLTFEEACRLEPDRPDPMPPEKRHARPFDYLKRSRYGTEAAVWLKDFPRDQLLFLLYEHIESQPARLLEELQEFLGVPVQSATGLNPGVVNAARETGPALLPATAAVLRREVFAAEVSRLRELTSLDLGAWNY